jgi:hypothetical protein
VNPRDKIERTERAQQASAVTLGAEVGVFLFFFPATIPWFVDSLRAYGAWGAWFWLVGFCLPPAIAGGRVWVRYGGDA